MAPTICSGKKRQTGTIATSSVRRHGQGPHQLNQTFSNAVNFAAKRSRVPIFLRTQTNNHIITTDSYRSANIEADLIYNFLIQTSAASATTHRLQRNSFLNDNAVTSSTHSDTENSLDLRLANEILSINTTTTTTCGSNTTSTSNATSLSPSPDTNSFQLHKESMPSPTPKRQDRLFHRCSTIKYTHKISGHTQDCSDDEEVDFCENGINNKLNLNKKITELHSRGKGKHVFSYDDFDSEDDELDKVRAFNSNMNGVGGDTDLATDEVDSMAGLNTEKSDELKRGNHPLLSDKLFVKHPADNNSNSNNRTKSRNTQRNTDGLLSIAIKTIKLVKRNQLLQKRLTQLQLETTEFIQSVLANPENCHFRENKQTVQHLQHEILAPKKAPKH